MGEKMITHNQQFDEAEYHKSISKWYLTFAWLPNRCSISGKLIWLKYAYSSTVRYGGPGGAGKTTIWRSEREHLIQLIKG